jgi:hypothetical protein
MDNALINRVPRGLGHTVLTTVGEIDIATVAGCASDCSRRPMRAAGDRRPQDS